ncbi:winged helix-turn-helix domain-containing protein [Serinicoccus sp. CNJ-927]
MSPARAPLSPEHLRLLRERAGLTQHEFARAVGVESPRVWWRL